MDCSMNGGLTISEVANAIRADARLKCDTSGVSVKPLGNITKSQQDARREIEFRRDIKLAEDCMQLGNGINMHELPTRESTSGKGGFHVHPLVYATSGK